MALPHRRQIVNQDNLKDYLENISEFRLGRIIRKGREVKNNIVYVEKSENGFLSDRVRLRHSVDHEQQQSQQQHSPLSSSSHGRRIWVAKEILMCSGHVNCQRDCGGMGSCRNDCSKKDEKRAKSGHRCSFRVNIRMYLHNIGNWEVDVMGHHVPPDHVWIPPKKDVMKKMKLNPSRSDTQTHLSMIVPKIETTEPQEDVSAHNVCVEQIPESVHIGGYCSNNYEQQKSAISLEAMAYPARDNLENEEALDLTQNQKSSFNSRDKEFDFTNNCLSTNKMADKGFNSPALQMSETLNKQSNFYSQKCTTSLGLFKEAVKLSEDGMQVFVIVSGDKNSYSYWGTKHFSDKFMSSQPLAKYDTFTCCNVFDNFTTNTSTQINGSNNPYNINPPLPSVPTTLKAGHLKIPSLYSLKKRSPLTFENSSPKKKKKQAELENDTHLPKRKSENDTHFPKRKSENDTHLPKRKSENDTHLPKRKSKSKPLKSDPHQQSCEKTSFDKKAIADVNQEILMCKKGKKKNDKCEPSLPKEGTGSSKLQRERSQALLRILMSRKKNLIKNSEINESPDQQKTESLNCNRKSDSSSHTAELHCNGSSPGSSKRLPASKQNSEGLNSTSVDKVLKQNAPSSNTENEDVNEKTHVQDAEDTALELTCDKNVHENNKGSRSGTSKHLPASKQSSEDLNSTPVNKVPCVLKQNAPPSNTENENANKKHAEETALELTYDKNVHGSNKKGGDQDRTKITITEKIILNNEKKRRKTKKKSNAKTESNQIS